MKKDSWKYGFRLEESDLEEGRRFQTAFKITGEIDDTRCVFREREIEKNWTLCEIYLKKESLKKFFLLLGLENIKKIMENK